MKLVWMDCGDDLTNLARLVWARGVWVLVVRAGSGTGAGGDNGLTLFTGAFTGGLRSLVREK